MAQSRVQSGDITGVVDLMIKRQTQGIMERIFRIVRERFLAGADGEIEMLNAARRE